MHIMYVYTHVPKEATAEVPLCIGCNLQRGEPPQLGAVFCSLAGPRPLSKMPRTEPDSAPVALDQVSYELCFTSGFGECHNYGLLQQ